MANAVVTHRRTDCGQSLLPGREVLVTRLGGAGGATARSPVQRAGQEFEGTSKRSLDEAPRPSLATEFSYVSLLSSPSPAPPSRRRSLSSAKRKAWHSSFCLAWAGRSRRQRATRGAEGEVIDMYYVLYVTVHSSREPAAEMATSCLGSSLPIPLCCSLLSASGTAIYPRSQTCGGQA